MSDQIERSNKLWDFIEELLFLYRWQDDELEIVEMYPAEDVTIVNIWNTSKNKKYLITVRLCLDRIAYNYSEFNSKNTLLYFRSFDLMGSYDSI